MSVLFAAMVEKAAHGEYQGVFRPEHLENIWPEADLVKFWSLAFDDVLDKLVEAKTMSEYVHAIRTSGLRAINAGNRGLRDWRDSWYGIKHDALISSVRHMEDFGSNMNLSAETMTEETILHFRFTFGETSRIYFCDTPASHIRHRLGEDEYKKLFGEIELFGKI